MLLMPKEHIRLIYTRLFTDGVLIAQKDFNLPKHPDLDVPNLHVIKCCENLTSREYVKTRFSWQYYYYTLTESGVEFMREWLHLPESVVPATYKKQQRAAHPSGFRRGGEGAYRPPRPDGGEDGGGGYRRRDRGVGEKEGGAASGEFQPSFRTSGYGRGQPNASA